MSPAWEFNCPKHFDFELGESCRDLKSVAAKVAMGAGSGGSCLWSLFWLVVLIILSVPVAGICAILYIIVSIFTPCIAPLKSFEDLLHKGVNFPHTCSQNMVHGSSL
ncbi:hypothetical protein MRX96_019513 [Rhipicephalus microplus]